MKLLMNIFNNSLVLETKNRTLQLMENLNSTIINVLKNKVLTCSWRIPGEHNFLNHLSESLIFVYNVAGNNSASKNFQSLILLTEKNYEYSANVFAGLIKFLNASIKESDFEDENEVKKDDIINEDTYNLIFKNTKHIIIDSIKNHKIKEHAKLLGNVRNIFI
jgi:hypothetical protein